jgi:hypothetical protein
MTISSVSSALSGYLTGSQNPYQTVKTTYGQLQQNATAGNIPGAQQVYTALAKAIQNSPIGQTGGAGYDAVQQSLAGVAQALQSGDLSGVQSALTLLGQNINAAAQNAGAAAPSPTTPLTPSQLTASLVNDIVTGGNATGTDPMLAAMSSSIGASAPTSSDPLLAALSGSNGATSTDPLLAALTAGVNIIV